MNSPAEPAFPTLSVAIDYTPAELARLNRMWTDRAHGRRGAWLARNWTLAFAGVGVVVLLLARMWVGAAFLALVGVLRYVRHDRPARLAATVAALSRARGLGGMFEVHVERDALRLRAPAADTTAPWSGISVEERDGDVILELPDMTVPIPARAFADPSARDHFVAALRARMAAPAPAAPPPAPGSVSYVLTRGDYRALALEKMRGAGVLLVLLVLFLLSAHAVALVVLGVFGDPPMPLLPLVARLVVSMCLWLGLILGPVLFQAELSARVPDTRRPVTVLVSADAFTVGEHSGNVVPWKQVRAISSRGRGLFLVIGPLTYLVPRRAFPTESAFRAFADDAQRYWRAGRGY